MKHKKSYWGTSGAGVLAVAEDTGRFLVGLRGEKTFEPGTWGTIGGRHEPQDKDLRATALREFQEETGYAGPMELIPIMDFKDPDVFQYRTYLGILPTENIEFKSNAENTDLKWFSYEELQKLDDKHYGLHILLDVAGEALKEFIGGGDDSNIRS